MARLELYKPVHSIKVTGFTHEEVQGMPVSAKATPFKEGHIPQFSVVSVNGNRNGADESSQLRLISKIHGRSYEFITGKENALFWADEYGNIFGALNTKGNNCNEPALQRDDVTPSGYRIYGMQDSDSMVRVLRASDMLRANHIDTEAIVKVIEPAEVPINGEVVPLDEVKRRFALGAWNNGFGAQEVTTIAQVLSNMTCFITIRGVQVNERMADLGEARNYAALVPLIMNAFRYVNLAEEVKAAQNPGYTADHFSIDNPDDVKRYFTEYLPERIADNYAQLHQLGLIHKFPHSGNISITGSIYDLDSVEGKPLGLGDKPVTNEEIFKDLKFLINENTDMFPRIDSVAFSITGSEGKKAFRNNFCKRYFAQMGWEGDIFMFDKVQAIVTEGISDSEQEEDLVDYYVDQIAEKVGLGYTLDTDEIISKATTVLAGVGVPDGNGDGPREFHTLIDNFKEVIEMHIKCRLLMHGFTDEQLNHPQFVEAFTELHAGRFLEKIYDAIDTHESFARYLESGEHTTAIIIRELIKQELMRQWNLEADVANNIVVIKKLFGDTDSENNKELLDYYMGKLIEQLGYSMVIPETAKELVTYFHEVDQFQIEECLTRDVFERTPPGARPKEVFIHALKNNSDQENYNADHGNRYFLNTSVYIEERIREIYGAEIGELHAKYGEEKTNSIIEMFVKKYEDEVSNSLTVEEFQAMEKQSQQRVETIIKKFVKRSEQEGNPDVDVIPYVLESYWKTSEFDFIGTDPIGDYCTDILLQQLEWDYALPDSLSQSMQKFHRIERRRLASEDKKKGIHRQFKDTVWDILAETATNELEEHEGFADYLFKRIKTDLKRRYQGKIKQLALECTSKYDYMHVNDDTPISAEEYEDIFDDILHRHARRTIRRQLTQVIDELKGKAVEEVMNIEKLP